MIDRMPRLEENLRGVRDRIDAAARAAGRDPASVALLAVSKTWPADDVAALAALGQRDFGENRARELIEKAGASWPCWPIRRGLPRPLALHRAAPAEQGRRGRASRRRRPLRRPAHPSSGFSTGWGEETGAPVEVLLQVDLGGTAAGAAPRGGAAQEEIPELADTVAAAAGLRLPGPDGRSTARCGPGTGLRAAGGPGGADPCGPSGGRRAVPRA